MANVDCIKIRAEIRVGKVTIVTPYIKAFNVTRARRQGGGAPPCAQFTATVKIPAGTSFDGIGSKVEIIAGREGKENRLFTGYVHKITINPCREDASYVIVNLSGRDILYRLEGQKFTRRVKAVQLARFGAITTMVQENEKFKERFPAKIRDNSERLISAPILNAEGNIVEAPSPPNIPFVEETSAGVESAFSINNLGHKD